MFSLSKNQIKIFIALFFICFYTAFALASHKGEHQALTIEDIKKNKPLLRKIALTIFKREQDITTIKKKDV